MIEYYQAMMQMLQDIVNTSKTAVESTLADSTAMCVDMDNKMTTGVEGLQSLSTNMLQNCNQQSQDLKALILKYFT